MTTVWIYADTSKQVGEPDRLKVFADADAADEWFKQHDPKGVAFEYPVIRGGGGTSRPPPIWQAR